MISVSTWVLSDNVDTYQLLLGAFMKSLLAERTSH